MIVSVAFDPYSKKYEDSWKGDPVPETENRDLRAVASKYFPVKSQGIPASERPKLYIDQLLDKCLHPKKYLYPEECQDRDRMVRLRANGCDFFAKNNLSDHAFLVADCVIQNHTQLEKEQICEKRFGSFYILLLAFSVFVRGSVCDTILSCQGMKKAETRF